MMVFRLFVPFVWKIKIFTCCLDQRFLLFVYYLRVERTVLGYQCKEKKMCADDFCVTERERMRVECCYCCCLCMRLSVLTVATLTSWLRAYVCIGIACVSESEKWRLYI